MNIKFLGYNSITHHLLFLGMLALSGFPYFTSNDFYYIGFFIFSFLVLFVERRTIEIKRNTLLIIGIPLLLIVLQAIVFRFFTLITIIGFCLRIFSAVLVIQVLRNNFLFYFLRHMKVLTLLSFVVYFPVALFPGFYELLKDSLPAIFSFQYDLWGMEIDRKTLILVNLNMDMPDWFPIRRNCGPFWESGAFGGFLMIALMVSTIKNKALFKTENLVFIVGILTTFSTTIYISFFSFVLMYFLIKESKVKAFIAPVIMLLGFLAYMNLGFLNDKIMGEITNLHSSIIEKQGDTRIASGFLDILEFSEHPIVGRGLWTETRVNVLFEYVVRNNGLTNFLTTWGLPFFVFFLTMFYKGFYWYALYNGMTGRIAAIALGVILLILIGENYFNFMFFWAFAMMSVYYKQEWDTKNDGSLLIKSDVKAIF